MDGGMGVDKTQNIEKPSGYEVVALERLSTADERAIRRMEVNPLNTDQNYRGLTPREKEVSDLDDKFLSVGALFVLKNKANDQIVGFMAIDKSDKVGKIEQLRLVSEENELRDIQSLISEATEYLRHEGCDAVVVSGSKPSSKLLEACEIAHFSLPEVEGEGDEQVTSIVKNLAG